MPENRPLAESIKRAVGVGSGFISMSGLLQSSVTQGNQNLNEPLSELIRNLTNLAVISQAQTDVLAANTQAVVQNTVVHGTGGIQNIAASIGKAASNILGGGLGLSPLIGGLLSRFTGDKPETPSLVKFELPQRVQFAAANTLMPLSGTLPSVDYGQSGSPRLVSLASSTRAVSAAPQVTVNVQAIDSRSFIDHSHEIAKAVRDAMLNMHSINDVVTDL